jgi:hypothetical protein
MKPGTRVRMSEAFKKLLLGNCDHRSLRSAEMCHKCSFGHVVEFGHCEGIVEELVQPDCVEVNVRWQPSGLRYGYDPKNLERV